MSNKILEIKGLQKSYDAEGHSSPIIPDLSMTIEEGSFTVIMGRSGTGKSTLLNLIAGIDRNYEGVIKVKDQNLLELSERSSSLFRREHIGLVFQDSLLLPNLTVLENVIIAAFNKKGSQRDIKSKAISLLLKAGLENCMARLPHQISGGERQRCAVIRALINEPSLLIADEPTGSLNSAASESILELFLDIHSAGQSLLMVTHDVKSALLGDRIIYLNDGKAIDEISFNENQKSWTEREEILNQWLIQRAW